MNVTQADPQIEIRTGDNSSVVIVKGCNNKVIINDRRTATNAGTDVYQASDL